MHFQTRLEEFETFMGFSLYNKFQFTESQNLCQDFGISAVENIQILECGQPCQEDCMALTRKVPLSLCTGPKSYARSSQV